MSHILIYPGEKVSLGLMQKSYASLFVEAVNREDEGIAGTAQRPPYTQAMFESFVDGLDQKKGKDEVFAVLVNEETEGKRTYRYVGHTGIHGITWPPGRAVTGSIIIDPECRGRGCGTEAKLLLLHHCFHVLNLTKVHSSVKAFNARSIGHLLKTGYRVWGRSQKNILHQGVFIDEIFLEVFREDFEPIWKQYQETKTLPKLTPEQRELVKRECSRV